jgi:hypothetical protein
MPSLSRTRRDAGFSDASGKGKQVSTVEFTALTGILEMFSHLSNLKLPSLECWRSELQCILASSGNKEIVPEVSSHFPVPESRRSETNNR